VRFPHLFRPGQIGSIEVRNRIIASPMERNYCTLEGRVTQVYIDYLEARARGGVGLMYTEATYVDPRGKGRGLQMGLYDDDLIPQLRKMVRAVQAHGARIGPELAAWCTPRSAASNPGRRRSCRTRAPRRSCRTR
jgi:2,4-dienoyl-CoA reductase-like NADH-dependent reductase (Old Yellow Enzyme family)